MIATTETHEPDNVLTAVVPDQPVHGAVVIDRRKWAWQRHGKRWVRNATPVPLLLFDVAPEARDSSLSWPSLIVHHGPVEVVYTPPATAEAKAAG